MVVDGLRTEEVILPGLFGMGLRSFPDELRDGFAEGLGVDLFEFLDTVFLLILGRFWVGREVGGTQVQRAGLWRILLVLGERIESLALGF